VHEDVVNPELKPLVDALIPVLVRKLLSDQKMEVKNDEGPDAESGPTECRNALR